MNNHKNLFFSNELWLRDFLGQYYIQNFFSFKKDGEGEILEINNSNTAMCFLESCLRYNACQIDELRGFLSKHGLETIPLFVTNDHEVLKKIADILSGNIFIVVKESSDFSFSCIDNLQSGGNAGLGINSKSETESKPSQRASSPKRSAPKIVPSNLKIDSTITGQTKTLKKAAKDGVPFCEEC